MGMSMVKEDTVSERSKWWYVIHGDESVLHLESNWEQINLQTSWKLEPCFMTESIPGSNAVHDSSDPGYATTTGNDGPKPPTSAPSPPPTVNLQTPLFSQNYGPRWHLG